jgi:predicted ATPase
VLPSQKSEIYCSRPGDIFEQRPFFSSLLGRGWARSAAGDIAGGISLIEDAVRDYRVSGSLLYLPGGLGLKAEVLHLAGRTPEALETIGEAEAVGERRRERWWSADLQRLRGVFLAALGADEAQIEAAFRQAIDTARQQKSVSLLKRAEASRADYHRRKGR